MKMTNRAQLLVPIDESTCHPYGNPPTEAAPVCEAFLVIHHPLENTFLLRSDERDGELPRVLHKGAYAYFYEKTSEWVPNVKRHLSCDFDVTVLRCMWYKTYRAIEKKYIPHDMVQAVVVMEAQGDVLNAPDGMEWMTMSSIRFPGVVMEEASGEIRKFLEECETGTQPIHRSLFARRGWYRRTVQWLRGHLTSIGYGDIHHVTQVRCQWRGCVLGCEMMDGTFVYLKCSPFFANEARRYEALEKLIPKYITKPLVIDTERCLVLLKDVGEIIPGCGIRGIEERNVWAREMSEIHQCTAEGTEVLLKAGFKLVTLEVMASMLDEIVEYVEGTKEIPKEYIVRFKPVQEALRQDCQEFNDFGFPPTFTHGDLAFSNIFMNESSEKKFGILDFAESAVSNPLLEFGCGNFKLYLETWKPRLKECSEQESAIYIDTHRYFNPKIELTRLRGMVLLFMEMNEFQGVDEPPEIRGHIQQAFINQIDQYENVRCAKRTRR